MGAFGGVAGSDVLVATSGHPGLQRIVPTWPVLYLITTALSMYLQYEHGCTLLGTQRCSVSWSLRLGTGHGYV